MPTTRQFYWAEFEEHLNHVNYSENMEKNYWFQSKNVYTSYAWVDKVSPHPQMLQNQNISLLLFFSFKFKSLSMSLRYSDFFKFTNSKIHSFGYTVYKLQKYIELCNHFHNQETEQSNNSQKILSSYSSPNQNTQKTCQSFICSSSLQFFLF